MRTNASPGGAKACSPGRKSGEFRRNRIKAPEGRKRASQFSAVAPPGLFKSGDTSSWGFRPRLHAVAPPGL
ncbi:MAG: hypothetical protein QF886_27430, partial [Planctomycetota bacterium]|nr:hypothetical protein [Planctomycetota bacterium]